MLSQSYKFNYKHHTPHNYLTCFSCGKVFCANDRFAAEVNLQNHIMNRHKNKYIEDIFSQEYDETYSNEYVEEFLKFLPD